MTDLTWIDEALVGARPQAVGALLRYFRDLDTAEEAFQVTLLGRTQRVVEDDDFSVFLVRGDPHLFRLAGTDEQCRIGPGALASHRAHGLRAGRGGQQRQFAQTFLKIMFAEIHGDQDGARRLRIGGGMGCQAGK